MLVKICLLPLVGIVLHSMMFSMVRARPMDKLEGYNNNQPFEGLQSLGEGSSESYVHAWEDAPQKDTGELSDLVKHVQHSPVASSSHPMSFGPVTEEEFRSLVKHIKTLREPNPHVE